MRLILTGIVVILAALIRSNHAVTVENFLHSADIGRLKEVFTTAATLKDLPSIHYSVAGRSLLGAAISNQEENCKTLKETVKKAITAENVFHASSAAKLLSNCQLGLSSAELQLVVDGTIKSTGKVEDIYYAIAAAKNLNFNVDNDKAKTALLEGLKTDETALSHGYAFLAGALLSGDLKKLVDAVEDVVAQSDEVDGRMRQFEGGVATTAIVIEGAFQLAATADKAPTINENDLFKFSNYFVNRRHVNNLKSAFYLAKVVKTLTTNKFFVPVAAVRASSITSPKVQIQVADLLGKAISEVGLVVTAEHAKRTQDGATVLSKEKFVAKSNGLYELDLQQKSNPGKGYYVVQLAASGLTAPHVGITGTHIQVKINAEIQVTDVDIAVGDREQTSTPRSERVPANGMLPNILDLDHHQKLGLTFKVTQKGNAAAISVHQAFVRLENEANGEEIIYMAEPDSATKLYKMDLDVLTSGKNFGFVSGVYKMELIVGDAVVENSQSWPIARLRLHFSEDGQPAVRYRDELKARPEIRHVFRVPEARPPMLVSNVFTVLVAAPLLILLVLWMKLGANLGGMSFSPATLGFHIGLGAIIGLLYCYWTYLDMFTTLRYLTIIGIVTFFAANRMLRHKAAQRTKSGKSD